MIGMVALAALLIVASIVTYLLQQGGPTAGRIGASNSPVATSTPVPTPTPTMTRHQRYQQLATQYVDKMSLEDMIGQLMIIQYTTADISDDLTRMIAQQHVGGVILYSNIADQLRTAEQVKGDTSQMQADAKIPLFIAVDEEGYNSVDRLGKIYNNPYHLSAREINETGDPAVAADEGARVAKDMLAIGLNLNFAPVVDVGVKDGYIDHDWRSFGSTPDKVIKYVAPYLAALQQGGVGGTLKHFPGIGSLPYGQDPHGELPVIEHSADEVYNIDLAPFKQLIQSSDPLQHPSMIMPTYVMVPSIDATTPVQYSVRFITDILRNELGYDGVVVTDSVVMQGAMYLNNQFLDVGARCVLSLKAGNDMILGIANATDLEEAITAIKAAIQDGTLTEYGLKQSVRRILTLKLERGVVPAELLTD
jgi:beta-N-acetylhexosaminidase